MIARALVAVLTVALAGAAAPATAQPPAGIDPFVPAELATTAPVLVHASRERFPLSSVRGSGVPGTASEPPGPAVYARTAGGWHQYWLWFPENTQDRGVLRSGRHAGDWELVQYRDDGSEAVYAQHAVAERCPAGQVESRGGRPVVYLAHGSHAAYFRAGTRDRMWPDPNDVADGRGVVLRPAVVPISAGSPGWMRHRGPWGGARAGWFPPEQSSPRGPAFQGDRWDDPEAFARSARPCTGRRCVSVGACDGGEAALASGFGVALLALACAVIVRRRRRTSPALDGEGE